MRWMRAVVALWLALLVPGCAGPAEAQPGKLAGASDDSLLAMARPPRLPRPPKQPPPKSSPAPKPATPPKDPLRIEGGVPRPTVSEPKLQNLMDDLYKGANASKPVGTGSTADAIRYEKLNRQPVGGTWHTQKGLEYVRALEKWLSKNPNASPSDRAAAQAVLDDLRHALAIKP